MKVITVLTGDNSVEEYLVKDLLYRTIRLDDVMFKNVVDRAVLLCDCKHISYIQHSKVTLNFKARVWVYNKGKSLEIFHVRVENCAREVSIIDEPFETEIQIDDWRDCRLYNADADEALLNSNQYKRIEDYANTVKEHLDEVRKSIDYIILMVPELNMTPSNVQSFKSNMNMNLAQLQSVVNDAVELKRQSVTDDIEFSAKDRESCLTEKGQQLEGINITIGL